jgi:hypothetical protein
LRNPRAKHAIRTLANSSSWTEQASTRYGGSNHAEHQRNTGQLVYSVAETPDLALVASEHVDVPHLHHGLREPQSPRRPVARVQVDERRRVVLADQRDVRRKQHLVRLHVLVVLVVEQERSVLGSRSTTRSRRPGAAGHRRRSDLP